VYAFICGSNAKLPSWSLVPTAAICLVLGALTWRQSRIYDNLESLWRDTIIKSPTSWIAYNNLATFLNIQRGPNDAAPYAEKAIKLSPQSPEPFLNLAMIRLDQGRADDAIGLLNEASRLYGRETPHVRFHRAKVLMAQRKLAEALREIDGTIAEMPGYAPAFFIQGRILMRAGRSREAKESFRRTLVIDPDFVEAICFLADASASEKQTDEAIKLYEAALERAPGYFQASFNYANLLLNIGRTSEALKLALQAVAIQPENPDAHVLVGAICLNMGQTTEAVGHFGEAIRVNPTHVEARFNLAGALKAIGRKQEAIDQYKAVLRLNPKDSEAKALLLELGESSGTTSQPWSHNP
jgi:tetratricopeptide (TPR) repeat protein